MLLCLDVGNTHILGGVFKDNNLLFRFRCKTQLIGTSDQFGMFLINIMQNNNILPENIEATAVASVVPGCDYTVKHTVLHYICNSYFVLQAGVKTGLNIKYKNSKEIGADRIANAIGAVNTFQNQNIIIVDMGTATTVCVITKNKDYIGGSILPGLKVAMESLKNNTAKLMEVDIEIPPTYIGRTTRECIQSGLYYSQLGALKEIISGIRNEVFHNESFVVIGTGGFSQLYKDKSLFDVILPDLVLQGLHKAYDYQCHSKQNKTEETC
jgi:type III pantothenate kinase